MIKELKRLNSKIEKFEKKYKMSFEEYEKAMGDTFQEHNDWIEWSYLVESRKQLVKESSFSPQP
jgi:uncharacterized protein YhaN